MVDYVKLKTSSPLTRNSKKLNGARYKEYLYGSIESLDMEWADKIVDYNPDLKVDTNGFTKFLDRNRSVSTDCDFDLNSTNNSNVDVDMYFPDYSKGSNTSDYVQVQNSVQFDYEKDDLNGRFKQKGVLSPSVNVQHTKNQNDVDEKVVEYQKLGEVYELHNYEELQKKYQELSSEFDKFKLEHESYVKDAELFRSCKDRMNLPKQEFDLEVDPKDKLELLLDHIYTVLSDTFGTENTLVFYLEKFANLYVNYQNKVQLELTSLRSKAEVVESLEKLVAEKTNYDKVLDQKDKTIDSLVEELKVSKQNYNFELNNVKEEFENVTSELKMKVEEVEKVRDKYKNENMSLKESVNNLTKQYTDLLSEQHEVLSQIPLVTLQNSNSTNDDAVYLQNGFKPNDVVFHADDFANYNSCFNSNTNSNLNVICNTHNNTSNDNYAHFNGNNNGDSDTNTHSHTKTNNIVSHNTVFKMNNELDSINKLNLVQNNIVENKNYVKSWPKLVDKSPQSQLQSSICTKLQTNTLESTKLLQSMVHALYKKNEEVMESVSKKDMVIKKQQGVICKLKRSIKEWESDAILWLDYVDQSSSILYHVN